MKTTLHRIGNSQGVILPKPLLAQLGLITPELDLTIESDAIVLRKPKAAARTGWAQAAQRVVAADDDRLVWPALSNENDDELTW
jgi:antitoxin MazE